VKLYEVELADPDSRPGVVWERLNIGASTLAHAASKARVRSRVRNHSIPLEVRKVEYKGELV
jgi:hypothetical protein